jgi:uncharacterized membrane protein YkvA (DUF1232 family)
MTTDRRKAAYTAAASAAASDGPSGFVARLASIPRMARDVLVGRYDGLSRGRLMLMVLAVVYIVSPIDLLPEAFLPMVGLADDAMVAGWLVAALVAATSAYGHWEGAAGFDTADPTVVPGYVVREDAV